VSVPVAIVTDSAAALPDDLLARHSISVVPMYLAIDGASYREGEQDFDVLTVDHVKTSGPTPEDFRAAIDASDAESVLVLTIASTMSATCDAAVLAAQAADRPARVLDTGTAAGAEALVVLAAAAAASRGESLDAVEAAARAAMSEVHLVASVPTLDHLVRSGRVPNIAGWAGRRLGIVPLFEFRSGGARPLRPALSEAAAHERMVAAVRRDARPGARLHVAALHSRAEATATELLARVTDGVETETSFLGPFGAVMEVHIGPGLVGLAWRWDAGDERLS
jgi:DegV family protein with EDD domain